MAKAAAGRFSVRSENVSEALAHLEARGFTPSKVEQGDQGLVILIFPPLFNDEMYRLVQALPVHLSAKAGIVMGDRSPFAPNGEG
jgi:hypothetical protein